MFIITAKCSKRRVVKILLIFALLLSLFLRCARAGIRLRRPSSPPEQMKSALRILPPSAGR